MKADVNWSSRLRWDASSASTRASRSKGQAEAALARLTVLLAELGLRPKPAKTRIVGLSAGGQG